MMSPTSHKHEYNVNNSDLIYDLNSLLHNAKLCYLLANKYKFSLRVVLKGGYLAPAIVECLATLPEFTIAIGNTDRLEYPNSPAIDVAMLYPGQAVEGISLHNSVRRFSEASISGIHRVSQAASPRSVIVPIATSEDREGIDVSDLVGFLQQVQQSFRNEVSIDGFQINYGCVSETPPNPKALKVILSAISSEEVRRHLSKQPVLSLGGSVLLPVLDQITIPQGFVPELRVGEAIVAGTVPGSKESIGLLKPAHYFARKLQTLRPNAHGEKRLLVDVGTYILDPGSGGIPNEGFTIESMGSEVSVVVDHKRDRGEAFDHLALPLNYCETERALDRCRGEFDQTFLSRSDLSVA